MYTIIYNKYYCYNATDLNSKYEKNPHSMSSNTYRTSTDSQEKNKFLDTKYNNLIIHNKVNFPEFKLTIVFK